MLFPTASQNPWPTTVSQPGKKYRFIHYRILQICRFKTSPPFGVITRNYRPPKPSANNRFEIREKYGQQIVATLARQLVQERKRPIDLKISKFEARPPIGL
jgi:hypothetical protein